MKKLVAITSTALAFAGAGTAQAANRDGWTHCKSLGYPRLALYEAHTTCKMAQGVEQWAYVDAEHFRVLGVRWSWLYEAHRSRTITAFAGKRLVKIEVR